MKPAVWAVLAAGTIAVAGVVTDRLAAVGLAYLGAAVGAVFVTTGVYRTRVVALTAQGLGAAAGLGLGALAAGPGTSPLTKIALAVGVGLVSGMIGAIGRLVAAGALMAVVCVGFAEFSDVSLPWWEQAAYYQVGTAAVLVVAVAPWLLRPDHHERAAIADIYDATARLLAVAGSPQAPSARAALAAASAAGRAAIYDHRLVSPLDRRPRRRRLLTAMSSAERVALVAAELHALGEPVDDGLIAAIRQSAADLRTGRFDASTAAPTPFVDVPDRDANGADPVYQPPSARGRMRAAVHIATGRSAVIAGLRLAWCIGIATAVTCSLHDETHSFWLPLTVAVVVRPEYGSVFLRTVNRAAGTLVGAVVAAGILIFAHSGWPVAIAAALSLGFAVLAAPKLYAISAVGVTCSALLSACIGGADPLYPGIRALDTLIGCVIAIVFGYLLWPGRATLPEAARLDPAAGAAVDFLRQACRPPTDRQDWPAVRERAYHQAHLVRAGAGAAVAEPPPIDELASLALPVAIALEDVVDAIALISSRIDAGTAPPSDDEVRELAGRIHGLPRLAELPTITNGPPGVAAYDHTIPTDRVLPEQDGPASVLTPLIARVDLLERHRAEL